MQAPAHPRIQYTKSLIVIVASQGELARISSAKKWRKSPYKPIQWSVSVILHKSVIPHKNHMLILTVPV